MCGKPASGNMAKNQQQICTRGEVHANPTDSRPVANVKQGQMSPCCSGWGKLTVVAESNEGGLGGHYKPQETVDDIVDDVGPDEEVLEAEETLVETLPSWFAAGAADILLAYLTATRRSFR